MKIEIIRYKSATIAEIISETIIIRETQDAINLMGEVNYLGSGKIIINEKNIISDFFDLKTGLAGDILQKFSTYKVQLAIIGDYTKFSSKSLEDFIFESNKHGHIIFVDSAEQAKERFSYMQNGSN